MIGPIAKSIADAAMKSIKAHEQKGKYAFTAEALKELLELCAEQGFQTGCDFTRKETKGK